MRKSKILKSRVAEKQNVKLDDFEIIKELGRGGYGRVFLAEHSSMKQLFAIKCIRKDRLLTPGTKTFDRTLLEKDILFSADHPFLAVMDYVF